MNCQCRQSALGFSSWVRFQDAANAANGFGNVTSQAGVYCIRVARIGETDPNKIIESYRRSPLYRAFQMMDVASDTFFESCGLGTGWGWKWYADYAGERLERIRSITFDAGGQAVCPILYIGFSKSLQGRMGQLMELEHTANHPL